MTLGLAWLTSLAAPRSAPAAEAPAAAHEPARRVALLSPAAQRRELNAAETQLRQRLAGPGADSPVLVLRDAAQLTLRIPARQLFEADSTRLKARAADTLPWSAVVALLRRHPRLTAEVDVYTDSLGGQSSNRTLSQQRAQALVATLRAAAIDVSRLSGNGYGASAELAINETPEGREQNRRVDVIFALGVRAAVASGGSRQ
jgi:outer membrane protein OmpA-like peptidoglycan-associated protein